ncbi:MPN527 family putative ECF transporter permease subunit [Mycoplasmopsis columboralis]|uniref:ECF transporter S component n=1 Tax=Mycoplasmopsis columboralis TaxID=171282 RepID=A0A449B5Y7_9BACT|nr:hypothetical protein [Mycoplasmopsis columboralis]VEU76024.1 Uncharacterised protein [Mycoplasmopsis columboralis]
MRKKTKRKSHCCIDKNISGHFLKSNTSTLKDYSPNNYIKYGVNDYRDISKIATSGLVLALALLFSAFSKFTPTVFSFLQFNFSLIPILFGFYLVGWKYGLGIIFINFLISPLFIPSSESFDIRYLGQFNLLMMHLIFVFIQIYSFKYIFRFTKNRFGTPQCSKHLLKRQWIIYLFSVASTLIITIFLLSTLNTFFVNLLYFKLLLKIPFSFESVIDAYKNFKVIFFNIDNYYAGSYVLYFVFNLLNLLLNLVVISLIWMTDWKTHFITNIKKKHNIFY